MNRVDFLAQKDKMNLNDQRTGVPELIGDCVMLNKKHILRASYNFAVQGGAIGAIQLLGEDGKPVVIPNKAIVTKALVDVITAFTSGGSATVALGLNTTTDIKAATAIASYTGITACIPVETAATCVKMTADRTATMTVATAALTAGRVMVFIEYVMSE